MRSTVYPITEDIMVPILEESGMSYNEDFFYYSPERINLEIRNIRLLKSLK